MNEVTATAGEVVVAKVPRLTDMYTVQYVRGHRWVIYSEQLSYADAERLAKALCEGGQPYRIVHIPAEEVKDGK